MPQQICYKMKKKQLHICRLDNKLWPRTLMEKIMSKHTSLKKSPTHFAIRIANIKGRP